jgi:hypothetical protein
MDNKQQEKAKKSYLNRMKTAVREHIKDVFTGIIKNGVGNAETLHDVKINTQQKLDDIVKSVFQRSKEDSHKLKLFATDVKETVKEAYHQAISAALHEAEDNKGKGEYSEIGDDFDLDDEDFLKEFDIDFDEDDLEDDDEDESSNESYKDLMNIKPKSIKNVSNECNYVWSLESFDRQSLAGSLILFINKCLLYYKAHINDRTLSDDNLDVVSWLESKISAEEDRNSLISLLSTVDHGIEVPDGSVDTKEMVTEVLNEAIPPVYEKRVGMEDPDVEEEMFDIKSADEEVLRELVQLGTVANDILDKISDTYLDDEASNAEVMIHSLLTDMNKMYLISKNRTDDNDIIIDTLVAMTKIPFKYLEKAILIDLNLVDEDLIDTARQAAVLFSNIFNK